MRLLLSIPVLLFSTFAMASNLQACFELDSKVYTAGVRLAEYRTDKVDVTYKVLRADDEKIVFNVYFTNLSRKPVTVDSSSFFITSLSSKETVSGDEVESGEAFPSTTLNHNDSAGGQISFSVKNPEGRWSFKNKLSDRTFTFNVKEVE